MSKPEDEYTEQLREWEYKNDHYLINDYLNYVKDCLDDDNFDIKEMESYWDWVEQEFIYSKDPHEVEE